MLVCDKNFCLLGGINHVLIHRNLLPISNKALLIMTQLTEFSTKAQFTKNTSIKNAYASEQDYVEEPRVQDSDIV